MKVSIHSLTINIFFNSEAIKVEQKIVFYFTTSCKQFSIYCIDHFLLKMLETNIV